MPEREIPLSRYSLPPPVSGTVRGRLGCGVVHNFPSEKMTGFPQRACIRVAKNNEIFRLQHNNEVFFVASDRHLSPWLKNDQPHQFLPTYATPIHARPSSGLAPHAAVPCFPRRRQ
jgi:hypothetical protein